MDVLSVIVILMVRAAQNQRARDIDQQTDRGDGSE